MKFQCFRCGHAWQPRIETEPHCCPKCKSYKWQSPKPEQRKTEVASGASKTSTAQNCTR
jgi:predicted  nucleic acid-binding Zn-ribbon protein